MYSVVMVAAMTMAPATPDWGFHQGGCYGSSCCGGYGYGGCCGGSAYGSCYGSSCCGGWGGCHGGGFCGLFSCGCHGTASVYSGCCGGGCCGGYPVAPYASLAFSGCCGGGPYYTGCMGYGSYYAPGGPVGVGMATVGGTYVTPAGGFVTPIPGGSADVGTAGAAGSAPSGGTGGKSGAGSSGAGTGSGSTGGKISVPGTPVLIGGLPGNRAQVVVLAPASAKLYAEGESTSLTGPERVFLTPELAAGRDFQYTLKLENGTESTTRQVVVRAGHRTVVDFTNGAEQVTTPVTVNLPAKAKLFVDGIPAAVTGGTHTFRTPELAKGKAFIYDLRAEVDKDGTTEVVSKKVTFNAGEPVTVDFVEPAAVRTASK